MKRETGLPFAVVARLVMSGMAGRPLRPDEDVRPINRDVADCRPENLEMWCAGRCLGQPGRWVLRRYGPHAA